MVSLSLPDCGRMKSPGCRSLAPFLRGCRFLLCVVRWDSMAAAVASLGVMLELVLNLSLLLNFPGLCITSDLSLRFRGRREWGGLSIEFERSLSLSPLLLYGPMPRQRQAFTE